MLGNRAMGCRYQFSRIAVLSFAAGFSMPALANRNYEDKEFLAPKVTAPVVVRTAQPEKLAHRSPPVLAPRYKAQIGSPFYVLEQASGNNLPEFSLWEVRPFERTQNRYSGSRLLLKASGIRIRSFGLAGFAITPGHIRIDSVLLLDEQGRLYRADLDLNDRDGSAPLSQILGEYTALESEAESSLHASRKDGMLVQISADGKVSELHPTLAPAWKIQRELSGSHPLPSLVVSSRKKIIDTRTVEDDAIWSATQEGAKLELSYEHAQHRQTSDLVELVQDQADGNRVQILYANRETALVRIGGHLVEFRPSLSGNLLSSEILEPDFFWKRIREFGIQYGLFREMIVLQPRQADRTTTKRSDISVREDRAQESGSLTQTKEKVTECEQALRRTLSMIP